jgi:hypothetical protein
MVYSGSAKVNISVCKQAGRRKSIVLFFHLAGQSFGAAFFCANKKPCYLSTAGETTY